MMREEQPNFEMIPKYEVDKNDEVPKWIVNEAFLINEALDKGAISKVEAQEGLAEDLEILQMMRSMVDIKYFVEYPSENLRGRNRGELLLELFESDVNLPNGESVTLAEYLGRRRQGISLAMSSLDESTAQAVRLLNENDVPVIGWVVVEDIEGYWTNKANTAETAKKTQEIRQWAQDNGLVLEALGFDIENPIDMGRALGSAKTSLFQLNIVDTIRHIREFRKAQQNYKETVTSITSSGRDPEAELHGLIQGLRNEGIKVESYEFPEIFKKVGMGGVMEVPIKKGEGGRVVEMMYTSEFGPLQKYGIDIMHSPDSIPALGIVSGKEDETPGRDLSGGKLPEHLSAEQLRRDISELLNHRLRLEEREFSLRELYLFALNDASVAIKLEAAMDEAFKEKGQQ